MTAEAVLASLKGVTDPDLQKDIVSLGFVKNVAVEGGQVSFTIELASPAPSRPERSGSPTWSPRRFANCGTAAE